MTTLGGSERDIIKARTTGVALCDLSEDEFDTSLTGILFKVSVISGCTLPTHNAHIDALEKEFGKFLIDNGYDTLTNEELLTAFRFNASGKYNDHIESYGHVFNLDYAGKVLRQYFSKRHTLDRALVDMYNNIERAEMMKRDDDRRRKKVIEQFNLFIEDEQNVLDLTDCYMQLLHDGAFANHKMYFDFLSEAKDEIKRSATEGAPIEKILSTFEVNLRNSFTAEKLAVKYLFGQMKKTGKNKIYSDDHVLLHPNFVMPDKEIKSEY